jgi:hypothetical protein
MFPKSEPSGANTLPSYNYNNTIRILVGSEERPFIVHADLICIKSKFFLAACSERWSKGEEKIIHLPEVKPETFQRYVDWTYGDAIVAEPGLDASIDMTVDMYLLGDVLDDVRLRNKTTKALLRHITVDRVAPGPRNMRLIWEMTPRSSLLRKLAVDSTATRLNPKKFEQYIELWPAGLVQQVAVKLRHQATNMHADVSRANVADYLEAEDGA